MRIIVLVKLPLNPYQYKFISEYLLVKEAPGRLHNLSWIFTMT